MKANAACACGFLIESVSPRKLTGVPVVYADKLGRNANIYPEDELIAAIDFYKKLINLDPTHRYMLAKHPEDENEEWVGLIAGVIDDLYYDKKEKALKADFTLLPTIWGHFIMWLLDNGYKVGLSIRGQAQGNPTYVEIGGKQVRAYIRKNLKLEGIDIVIYPSLTTLASGEYMSDRVIESYVRKASQDLGIDPKILEAALQPNHDRRDDMINKEMVFKRQPPSASDAPDGQTAQSTDNGGMVFTDLAGLQGVIERLNAQREQLLSELADLDSQLRNLQGQIDKEAELHSQLSNKRVALQNELKALEEELEAKKKEYEELAALIEDANKQLEKVEEQVKRKVVVRFAGRTFTEDKPPKIRVIPVDEKVDNSPWGRVYKRDLRKLVWLTKDEKLAKEVFGIVRSMDHYEDLLYPVYKPYKSKDKNYDIDLVLNMQGLKTALAFFFGRPGMSLSRDERKQLLKFLLKKYKQLDEAGIHPVPDTLLKAAKRLRVAEMFASDDEVAEAILAATVLRGLIEVDVEDEDSIKEQSVSISGDTVFDAVAAAVLKALTEEGELNLEGLLKVTEQAADGSFIKKLLQKPDGSPTSFAQKYQIENEDTFKTSFVPSLMAMIEEGKVADFVTAIKDMVVGYGEATLAEDQAKALAQFMDFVFAGIVDLFPKEEAPEANTEPAQSANSTAPEGQPVEEKRKCKPKKKNDADSDEPVQGQQGNNITEVDEMIFEQLKEKLEGQFDGLKIESPEELIETVNKLITDYTELYAQVQAMEIEKVKEQKIQELVSAGVDEDVAREELSEVMDPDEIEQIAATLMKLASKVQEQRKGTFIPTGKGVSVVKKGADISKSSSTGLDQLLDIV